MPEPRQGKSTDRTDFGDPFRIFDPEEHGQVDAEERKERERDVGTRRT